MILMMRGLCNVTLVSMRFQPKNFSNKLKKSKNVNISEAANEVNNFEEKHIDIE